VGLRPVVAAGAGGLTVSAEAAVSTARGTAAAPAPAACRERYCQRIRTASESRTANNNRHCPRSFGSFLVSGQVRRRMERLAHTTRNVARAVRAEDHVQESKPGVLRTGGGEATGSGRKRKMRRL